MIIKKTNDLLVIHETPCEEIHINSNSITIEFDDINEARRKIFFCPFQAVRITTIDCVDLDTVIVPESYSNGRYRRYLLECIDSPWIDNLKSQLVDSTDDFLEKSKHFMLDLGDNLLEIIAWSANIL